MAREGLWASRRPREKQWVTARVEGTTRRPYGGAAGGLEKRTATKPASYPSPRHVSRYTPCTGHCSQQRQWVRVRDDCSPQVLYTHMPTG